MVARRATLSERAFRNEARIAEKKKQQGKKPKPRDKFDVDRNILVTETEEDFLQTERKWNQFKFKTTADLDWSASLYNDGKHSSGKRYLPQDNGQMSKKLNLEKKSLFKNW